MVRFHWRKKKKARAYFLAHHLTMVFIIIWMRNPAESLWRRRKLDSEFQNAMKLCETFSQSYSAQLVSNLRWWARWRWWQRYEQKSEPDLFEHSVQMRRCESWNAERNQVLLHHSYKVKMMWGLIPTSSRCSNGIVGNGCHWILHDD